MGYLVFYSLYKNQGEVEKIHTHKVEIRINIKFDTLFIYFFFIPAMGHILYVHYLSKYVIEV